MVKVKFGQIHLNEVCVGEILQLLGNWFTCSDIKKKKILCLYLDISCLISSPVETICKKSQIFISGKNMKTVSLCSIHISMYPSQSCCYYCPPPFEEKRRDTVFGFPWCVVRGSEFLISGVVGWCEGVMYLMSSGRPADIGLQLGKACYPCSR